MISTVWVISVHYGRFIKLKLFIFKIEKVPADAIDRLGWRFMTAALSAWALAAVFAVSVPAFAQQPPPTPIQSDSRPSDPAAANTLADPSPSDDSVESIVPHFKDTRFWLSGQANCIFQTIGDSIYEPS